MKKIVCFVFLVLAARINAQVCYSNATYFNAASGPWTIINKDFNNDGKPDIATANQFGNCIAVLLGDGTGNFGVPSTYVTGFHPVSAFSADFNNDNNADIVTANYGTGTISVFLGAGNGTFGTATTFTAGTQSSSVTGADFNTDGKIDLAVANYGANNFSVFMGDGTGNFNLTANYAVSTNPTSITSSDFNGDNFIDIASCNYSTNSVSVLLGNGAGSFGSRQDFIVGSHPQFIVSADLTNDGKPDLATANISAGTVSLLKNLGSGSFGSIVNVFVNDNPYSLTASDLNGDGNIDLGVGHNSANYVSVLLGDGNGSVSSVTIDSSFQNPQFVTSADFNGDGKPEIASGNYNSNNVAVFINCTPPPTCTVSVTVNTPPAICINASAMLSASGATTYNWFPSTGLSTTTGSTVVASPTVTTTYTITGHSVGCLPSSSVITVTVLPTAVPTVTVNSPSVCAGGTVTLTANGASSYSWSPSIGLSAVGGSTVSASPTSTTIYTITGANGTCTSTANSTVTIKPVAVVSVNSSTICAGNSAVLTASGASTYTWSTGSTASTITVSPSSSSVYTLIASNGTCTAVDSASVHVNNFPLPTVTCHATQTFVCGGSPVTLYAAGANTYSWSTWNFTNWVGDSITFTPSIGATYNVTGVDVNGCKGSSSISISVSNINVITSASSYTFCPGTPFNDTLRASGATSYTWSANAGSAITTSVVVSPSVTTTYTVTGQNASGCTSVKSITVNSQAPVITQVSDLFVCSGLMVPAINFTTTVLGSSVTWHNSNTAIGLSATGGGNIASYGSPNTFVQKAGTLSVTASKNGCVGPPMYFNITINPKPLITVSATSNTICAGNADTLTAAGASTYTWSANAGNAVSPVVYVSPVSSTVYTINATDLNGCSNYGFTKSVTVNALPAISANATATIVCNGTNVTLTGGGGNTYTWSPAATLSSVNGTTVTATPTASTVYTVTGTGGTCTATATSTVIVNPTPTISVNSDTICLGQYASLIAGGGNTYTWSPATTLSSANGATVTATPASITVYTISGTVGNCTSSATSTVAVNALPDVTVNSNALCAAGSTTLCASGASTYTWVPNYAISATNVACVAVDPTVSVNYTVSGTGTNGCINSAIAYVTLTPCVWPGDADENLVVDNTDLLSIGVKYGKTGPVRIIQGNVWQGDLCNDWADTLSNGKNLKFSDCNGDGTVDMNDTLAINLNYSQTHSARSGHQIIQASNPDIYLQFDKPRYIRGDTVNASVFIGDASNPQSNFYGAAFNLQYDNSKVQTGTEKFWYNNSWVGNIDQSKIKFSRINPGVGVVDASLVRITHTDTNGFGKVATLSFVLTDSVLVGEMFLTITNAIKTNSSGNISNLNAGTDSLEIVDPTTEIQQVLNKLFSVFPNPATDKISIRSSVELGTIVIYNSLGEVIFQILSKDRQEQIDISKFPAGVYFVEVRNSRVKFIKN